MRILLPCILCGLFVACNSQPTTNQPSKAKQDSTERAHFVNSDSSRFPEPKGYVNDFEQIFLANEVLQLDSIITQFEKESTIEIAIVTIDSAMLGGDILDSFTLKLANNWGVGKKESDNGILIAISRGLRQMRIQNGYGIGKLISNEETAVIIDRFFIPGFKTGHYFEGTLNGLNQLIHKLRSRINKKPGA